jgi:hypothetical protein
VVNSNLATQEFTAAASTNQASQPDAQSTAVQCGSVSAEGGAGEVMTGEDGTNCPNPVLTNALFSSLLQGVMQEVAGVVGGNYSLNTVAHFLRNIPDFNYTAGESFPFDLFMTMVKYLNDDYEMLVIKLKDFFF